MAAVTKIEGEEITLGAEKYILPPVPLVKMASISRVMGGGDFFADDAYTQSLVNAIHVSLVRNYPELPVEVVSDNLDMANFRDILETFMVVNKFQTKAVSAGE